METSPSSKAERRRPKIAFGCALFFTGGLVLLSSFIPDELDAFDYFLIFASLFAVDGVIETFQRQFRI